MRNQFTAREVFEVSEKVIKEMKESGVPQYQLDIVQLGYLSLYSELVIVAVDEIVEVIENEATNCR